MVPSRSRRGVLLFALLAGVAIAAPWLAPYHPDRQLDIVALKSVAPSLQHPFGTDLVSRDVYSRVLHGARVSLTFSLVSVLLGVLVGTLYGACTAFGPAPLRTLLRRLLDVAMSVPRLLVLLAVTGVAGPFGLGGLLLLVGLTGWFGVARLVTDALDALHTRDFTVAARAMGVRTTRLLWRHLLPHLAPVLVVTATFGIADAIALEAGLSYLGLGLRPPTASWGTILNEGAANVQDAWWLTLFPGLATVLAVVACNAVGDALRERFAPTQFAGASADAFPSWSAARSTPAAAPSSSTTS